MENVCKSKIFYNTDGDEFKSSNSRKGIYMYTSNEFNFRELMGLK